MKEEELQGRLLWKKKARAVVKKHYILLVLLCLVSVLYGTEFSYVNSHAQDTYNFIAGQDPNGTGILVRIDGKSLIEIVDLRPDSGNHCRSRWGQGWI